MGHKNKHFKKGRSADGTSCVSCGDSIDTSRIAESHEYDGEMHHFDEDGDYVSVHYAKGDDNNDPGTHCKDCHREVEKRNQADYDRWYHEANNDYMRDT